MSVALIVAEIKALRGWQEYPVGGRSSLLSVALPDG